MRSCSLPRLKKRVRSVRLVGYQYIHQLVDRFFFPAGMSVVDGLLNRSVMILLHNRFVFPAAGPGRNRE